MGMVVRTNTMAMNANRQLSINNTQVGKSLEKLSSGFRINRAADDPSGLAISEKMKAQITGLDQAAANAQDGVSLIQTAEGATQQIHSMLNRMVELATKSANGTIKNEVDRVAIQQEVNDLNGEITRIASSTNFNGIKLLDGTMSGGGKAGAIVPTEVTIAGAKVVGQDAAATTTKTGEIQVGAGGTGAANGTVTFKYKGADGKEKTITTAATTVVTTTSSAKDNADDIVKALNDNAEFKGLFTAKADTAGKVTIEAAKAGAGLEITGVSTTIQRTTADKAFTDVTTGFTKGTDATKTFDMSGAHKNGDKVVVDGKTYTYVAGADGTDGKTFDTLANFVTAAKVNGITVDGNDSTKVTFSKEGGAAGGGLSLQIGDTNDAFNKVTVSVADLSAKGIGTEALDVSTETAAGAALDTIKTAINTVSTNRANLGSLQNRLEYTIDNLNTTSENMTAANSRIRDTDMAKEMMSYTKMNILTQAAQAMLAQANQQPQAILQLLQ